MSKQIIDARNDLIDQLLNENKKLREELYAVKAAAWSDKQSQYWILTANREMKTGNGIRTR